jgi:hypothetical protein
VDEGKGMGAKGRDAKGGKGGNGKGGKGSDGKGEKISYPNNGLLYNHSMWHDDNDIRTDDYGTNTAPTPSLSVIRTERPHGTRTEVKNHLSKIILFLDFTKVVLPNMTNIEGYNSPKLYAVVQTLTEQPTPCRDSVLLSTCTLSKEYYLVPTSSFHKPAFVVDNVGCANGSMFVVPPMDEWADSFL